VSVPLADDETASMHHVAEMRARLHALADGDLDVLAVEADDRDPAIAAAPVLGVVGHDGHRPEADLDVQGHAAWHRVHGLAVGRLDSHPAYRRSAVQWQAPYSSQSLEQGKTWPAKRA
jgi:hypothetical protein